MKLNKNEQIQLYLGVKHALETPGADSYPFSLKYYLLTVKGLLKAPVSTIDGVLKETYKDKFKAVTLEMEKNGEKTKSGSPLISPKPKIFNYLAFLNIVIPHKNFTKSYQQIVVPLLEELNTMSLELDTEFEKDKSDFNIKNIEYSKFEESKNFPVVSLDIMMELGLIGPEQDKVEKK